ncbi:MAG: hypothetical protein AB7E95_11090, partial [Kiritimatiellales bacterium]
AWSLQTIAVSEATWLALDFVEGSSLTVGSATTLSGNTINGIGFYMSSVDAALRLDALEVQTDIIPEPKTVSLILLSSVCLLLIRRRVR